MLCGLDVQGRALCPSATRMATQRNGRNISAIRVADGHRARPCTSVEGSSSQFLEAFDDVVYVWVVVIVYGILVPS